MDRYDIVSDDTTQMSNWDVEKTKSGEWRKNSDVEILEKELEAEKRKTRGLEMQIQGIARNIINQFPGVEF